MREELAMFMKGISDTDKHLLDGLSVVTAVATLTNHLPSIAAILTIIWTGIRIFETETVQNWLGRNKNDKLDE